MRSRARSAAAAAWQHLYKSRKWERLRAAHLARQPLCAWCAKRGKAVRARVVHHRSRHLGDAERFFDATGLESLCQACHNGPAQSQERIERDDEQRGHSTAIGIDGWPLDARDPRHPDYIEAAASRAKSLTGRG